jgi:beta-lactamase superfamily II metal-dependent hydrolase
MSMVRSFTVGNGDMFYIRHGSDNFTIIDCQLFGEHKEWLTEEIKEESAKKGITRFISTHPDEDHIEGLKHLDDAISIVNFYVVKNAATKVDETESFKHYCQLRDGIHAYYVEKGCARRWLNQGGEGRGSSGINILWPDTANTHFKAALKEAAAGTKFNNISLVARYEITDGISFMWIGDLETKFMEDILDSIDLLETTVVFAPHHGRKSGKLPDKWLDKLKPKIIVIGEAKSRNLYYYGGYNKITQTRAGDITFVTDGKKLHCYASYKAYGKRDWLKDEGKKNEEFGKRDTDYYIGTLNI